MDEVDRLVHKQAVWGAFVESKDLRILTCQCMVQYSLW